MIEVLERPLLPFHTMRRLHIYQPDDRREHERFPVFYMFDGHNLFDDDWATYGKSWGLEAFAKQHDLRCMIVGLECSHEDGRRLIEFSPYPFKGKEEVRPGLGKELMLWMTQDLKEWVDQQYPTLPDRRHTLIGGSSMGGLMSLYAIMAHNDIYGAAACLSPHHSFCMPALLHDAKRDIVPDTRIYISWGSDESPNKEQLARWTNNNLRIVRTIGNRAMTYPHLILHGRHCEASWEKETLTWVRELGFAEFMK